MISQLEESQNWMIKLIRRKNKVALAYNVLECDSERDLGRLRQWCLTFLKKSRKILDKYSTGMFYSILGKIEEQIGGEGSLSSKYYEKACELECPLAQLRLAESLSESEKEKSDSLLSKCAEIKLYKACTVSSSREKWFLKELSQEGKEKGCPFALLVEYESTSQKEEFLDKLFEQKHFEALQRIVSTFPKDKDLLEKFIQLVEKMEESSPSGEICFRLALLCKQFPDKECRVVPLLTKACNMNHFHSFFELGEIYSSGKFGSPLDEVRASACYLEGLELGDLRCYSKLVSLLTRKLDSSSHGRQVALTILDVMEKAHEILCFDASLKLAEKYFEGDYCEKDYKKAYKFYKRIYECGDLKVAEIIAKMLREGLGVEKNEKKAKKILQMVNKTRRGKHWISNKSFFIAFFIAFLTIFVIYMFV